MMTHHGKDFILGAMIGSTLGALTAAMFTTKKGHKVQRHLMDKYHEFEEMVKHYAEGKKRKAKSTVKKIAKKADRKIQRTAKKIHKKLKTP